MLSRAAAPLHGVRSVTAASLALGPGLAHAETAGSAPLSGGAGMTLVVALLLLAAACLTALLMLLLRGDAAARLSRRRLQARLQRLNHPAAISRMSGSLEWTNRALCSAHGEGSDEIVGRLSTGITVDAGLIYRLARRAREFGFAIEPTRRLKDGEPLLLTVQHEGSDRLVWTVCPPESLPKISWEEEATTFEAGPIAHLHFDDYGKATANRRFRTMFGDPAALPEGFPQTAESPACGRFLIPCRDGHTQLCDLCVVRTPEQSENSRDVFIFPIGEGEAAAGPTATLEAVPIALVQFDLRGRLLWCNAPAREILGPSVRSGIPLEDLVKPLGRPLEGLISEAAADAKGRREMVRLRSDAGETFLQIALTPVNLEGNRTLLAVLSDASELRLLEDKFAQSQKMEAVGKLAGGVAHDFNNVLTAISGHSDLLLLGKDALHPDYSDLMQIRQNTHRAAALVRQLLAFSRKQTLNPTLLSVQDVVSDTQYLLNRLVGEKVTLTLEHGRELGSVRADHQQLEQALMNLVVNARDAMPDGGMITIATRNLTLDAPMVTQGVDIPAGKYVEISVADSGAGIQPSALPHVFEPFFTTKAVGEGTGLGLSTVYGIVKQSGGYVFAENRPEGGARFRILLPRVSPASEPAPQLREAAESDRRDLTGKGKILLVEDEDPVRSFASRALKLRGYEVSVAASAEEAMRVLTDSNAQVDLLVSDVVMPGMDGPTLAAHARKLRPGLQVVFISGYAEDSFRRNLADHSFLFLPKPFSLTDLTAKVKEALDRAG
jgi:two-component system cell cycle sensor histidine kinase/response regulator CckA